MDAPLQLVPERCELEHKLFTSLGEIRFRRSGHDGLPVMALNMGEREASIPLPSLRREFKIGDETHDGRMLDLIGTSLDFITVIQPGDTFPPEIRTGEASWQPTPVHLRIAAARLRLHVVTWLDPSSRWALAKQDTPTLLRLSNEPGFAADVTALAAQGARELGLGAADELLQLVDDLAAELSFIEALRERLMVRVEQLCQRLGTLRVSGPHIEMLAQINRLSQLAMRQIRSRFDEVDGQTAGIGSLLRGADHQRGFIRSNRDWLYRSQRAWQPVLDQWDRALKPVAGEIADLLGSTYRFLAPRFMPASEWLSQRRPRRRAQTPVQMQW